MNARSARELAEDVGAYAPAFPGAELLVNERYALYLGVAPHLAFVQRIRLAPDEVEATVGEVERIATETDHAPPSWWVGDSAQPPDLAERLQALGFAHVEELKAMALDRPPRGEPALEVRRVQSFAELVTAIEIGWEAFEVPESARAGLRPKLEVQWEERKDLAGWVMYLAYDEGRPIAAGTGEFMPQGVFLAGGSTLPDARGRGAYAALVHARWHDAVERGTPLLVTQAREGSARVLEHLGFETLARIQLYERP